MQNQFFSIVVVALNPGEKLVETVESIIEQTYPHFEIIIKDGGSVDSSIEHFKKNEKLYKDSRIKLFEEKDKSIYDGMNQAISHTNGTYLLFLNCGDTFCDPYVLEHVARFIEKNKAYEIYYGDQFNLLQKVAVHSVPQINEFALFRNVPCHQVCFYHKHLFEERGYHIEFKVRADYEHFLHAIYEKKAKAIHMTILIANYEGGGFSETKENRIQSKKEHEIITKKYMGIRRWKYKMILLVTLSFLRTKIAESKHLAPMYNKIKNKCYEIKKKGAK